MDSPSVSDELLKYSARFHLMCAYSLQSQGTPLSFITISSNFSISSEVVTSFGRHGRFSSKELVGLRSNLAAQYFVVNNVGFNLIVYALFQEKVFYHC